MGCLNYSSFAAMIVLCTLVSNNIVPTSSFTAPVPSIPSIIARRGQFRGQLKQQQLRARCSDYDDDPVPVEVPHPPLSELLAVAKQAALKAGQILTAAHCATSNNNSPISVTSKSSPQDLLTPYDLLSQSSLTSTLKSSYPTHYPPRYVRNVGSSETYYDTYINEVIHEV